MAHSLYRFISWHRGLQKWVAQVNCRKKTWYKAFSEEVDAIDFVVRVTRRSKLALLRQPPRARAFLSRYRGVCWHRGNQKWIIQHAGKTLGAYLTQEHAATELSRRLGVEKQSLRKKRVKFPKPYAIKRLQLMMPIFQSGVPGDLESAIEHVSKSRSMFREEPVFNIISVMSKYKPFKECLLSAWQAQRHTAQTSRAQFIFSVVARACISYSAVSIDVLNPWIEHCGKNVSHHMGPLPLCRRLGVLVPCKRSHPKVLRMGKNAKPVRVATYLREKTAARVRLTKVINFVQTLGHIKVARTCKAWGQMTHQVMSAIAETKPPGLGYTQRSGYTQRWLARSMLVAVGGRGGRGSLTSGTLQLRNLQRHFRTLSNGWHCCSHQTCKSRRPWHCASMLAHLHCSRCIYA